MIDLVLFIIVRIQTGGVVYDRDRVIGLISLDELGSPICLFDVGVNRGHFVTVHGIAHIQGDSLGDVEDGGLALAVKDVLHTVDSLVGVVGDGRSGPVERVIDDIDLQAALVLVIDD